MLFRWIFAASVAKQEQEPELRAEDEIQPKKKQLEKEARNAFFSC